MRKSVFLLLVYVLIIFLTSCSKEESCGCEVVTIEDVNYSISECAPEVFFNGEVTPKQARIQEARDDCQ